MASTSDIQLASVAAGFTLGFGFLTVWKAIQHTVRNRRPWKSLYIYMIWGEIAANLSIGIIGWVFLDGIIGPSLPVLFFFLFLWVFEIQLLMQIIVNRIAIIAENENTVWRLKWGTAAIITCINIAVFCIWIPAHTAPPASELYVRINEIWDRISKILILFVDAGLNYYFLRTVKQRLVLQHGLSKYAPLVSFNAKLMIVSILMDAMLIGLMSLPNQVVYIQFHPVTYMVKLNIEMEMAELITKLAKGENSDMKLPSTSGHRTQANEEEEEERSQVPHHYRMQSIHRSKPSAEDSSSIEDDMGQFDDSKAASTRGILDGGIQVETVISSRTSRNSRIANGGGMGMNRGSDDELPLSYPVR
ncbi:hypothetical protein BBK36DRAFT_1130661 [Trichoderma citrinoviride]|uniref:Uncharacterized protein n=1 Tax=Trichoderma citrinoviride TaxID=58853 RepID=A0A2T4AXQ8_9HYPO|nr:hypothetical protein BBK36DRAFT_1130661 [Trichoderma citrinoviride]PTB61867.1 hypothetical protein BBK36DRAFT_1130661 [Trichoderma citrinoviride]